MTREQKAFENSVFVCHIALFLYESNEQAALKKKTHTAPCQLQRKPFGYLIALDQVSLM